MHHPITEDTPPDMLSGAMDLAIRLPDGRTVNMAVERRTPMMDLLVQVTTANKLRPSDHYMQALDMASGERLLPYKPNTPIGALNTQRVRVLTKGRTAPQPPLGATTTMQSLQQPFESTFRLQVHLPRNQFYVIRVSKHVQLEDIIKRVCHEKNLDARKYELRHPGNLDCVLDPKRTLNDYGITEIKVVHRIVTGDSTTSATTNNTLSTDDIMMLQREEERRKLKTSSGVLGLIFRRGRTSTGSGSVSSDTRSISPTQSDDSRSVTPPTLPVLPTITQERPKPPQRKRRPAPKPPSDPQQPQQQQQPPPPSSTQEQQQTQSQDECTPKSKCDRSEDGMTGLTICHSRNSSDSSGYHEASILSDNFNTTTLPRKPKSTVINSHLTSSTLSIDKTIEETQTLNNSHSKSTMSLVTAGRKKKAPPPPPPQLRCSISETNINASSSTVKLPEPSSTAVVRVVAPLTSPPAATTETAVVASSTIPLISDDLAVPQPKPRTVIETLTPVPMPRNTVNVPQQHDHIHAFNNVAVENVHDTVTRNEEMLNEPSTDSSGFPSLTSLFSLRTVDSLPTFLDNNVDIKKWGNVQNLDGISYTSYDDDINIWPSDTESSCPPTPSKLGPRSSDASIQTSDVNEDITNNTSEVLQTSEISNEKISSSRTSNASEVIQTSEISNGKIASLGISNISEVLQTSEIPNGKLSSPRTSNVSEVLQTSEIPNGKLSSPRTSNVSEVLQTSEIPNGKISSPRTSNGFEVIQTSKISNSENSSSRTSSVPEVFQTPRTSNASEVSNTNISSVVSKGEISSRRTSKVSEVFQTSEPSNTRKSSIVSTQDEVDVNVIPNASEPINIEGNIDLECDWQYTLPSPPKAFRDSSPTNFTNYDTVTINGLPNGSVITSPILYEKLETLSQNDTRTVAPQEISVEHLERRKSLVAEKELASLHVYSATDNLQQNKRKDLLNEIEQVLQNNKTNNNNKKANVSRSNSQTHEKILQAAINDGALPNFQITTYNEPKRKINIFEDDSIRSNVEYAPKRNSISDFTEVNFTENEQSTYLAKKRNSLITNSTKRSSLDLTTDSFLFKKPLEPSRSESFSMHQNTWTRNNPVKRSKSHIALDRNKDYRDRTILKQSEDGLYKSNSLYNVSGLQSLEVMRMILPKLGNTPPNTPEVNVIPKLNTPPVSVEVTPQPEPSPVKEPTVQPKKYQYSGPPAINLGTWSERPKTQVSLKEDSDYKINNVSAMRAKFNSQTNLNEIKDQVDGTSKINVFKVMNQQDTVPVTTNVTSVKINSAYTNNNNTAYGRFLNHSTAVGFRKPLGNINGMDKPRPHSIAFDSTCPDLSRMPIVRAVELKKQYQQQTVNKSITHIIPTAPAPVPITLPMTNGNCNNNTNTTTTSIYLTGAENDKVFTKPVIRGNSFTARIPVVKGFRVTQPQPPPPPMNFPKVMAVTKKPIQQENDQRGELLASIRSFGGRAGLRTVK